jgi:soluble lytic murein transglycosylase
VPRKIPLLFIIVLLLFFPLISWRCEVASKLSIPQLSPTATSTPIPTFTLTPSYTPTPLPTSTPLPIIQVKKADAALENGDWEKAQEEFQNALNNTTDQALIFEARKGLARTAFLSKDIPLAITEFESIIADYPQSTELAEVYFHLAQAFTSSERYEEAAAAFEQYLTLRPGIIDGYVHELRGDALYAAGHYLQAAQSYNASLQSPSQIDQTYLAMKYARSLALGGDTENALLTYDSLYNQTSNENTRALINLRKGQIYTDLGLIDQAYSAFQDSVNNYPASYESYSALVTLVEAGVPVDELNRGLVDYFAGEYGVALAAFERYLMKNPADPATALYYSGLAHRAAGRPQDAIIAWDKVIKNYPEHLYWDEALEQKGFTQWYYFDDYLEAEKTLLQLPESIPTHPRAAEFLADAARVAERRADLVRAAELWQKVTIQYPEDERAQNSLFLSAIAHYRMKNYSEALQDFKGFLTISKVPYDRAKAMLWIGKSQEASGDLELAKQSWEEAASMDPTGYYSERANELLLDRQPFSPPEVFDLGGDLELERERAEAWIKKTFLIPEDIVLSGLGELASEPGMIRGTELWNLGMKESSRQEFEAIRLASSDDPVTSYRLALYFKEIRLFRSATFAARQVLTLAGMDDATSLNAPLYINRIRFGTYYSDLVFPIANQYGLNPFFLFSVIRQESLFESFVSSSAAAQGLMQIMPTTGEEIAQDLGWPVNYNEDDLNRPLVNLNFGANYLARQLFAFNNDIFAALAAYNGGPGNAAQWKELAIDDLDLFLEVVRFRETSEYIRRVYENFTIYRRFYNRSP